MFQYHTLQLFLALQQKCQSAPLDVARNWNEFNQRSFEQVLAHLTGSRIGGTADEYRASQQE